MDNETFVGEIATPVQNINYEKLRSAVKAIGFGYAFLYLNLNLGRVNLLPNWVGYVLIHEACDDIGEQEPSIVLLKPLAALLAGYEGVLWLCKLFDISFSIPAVEVVIAVVSLYFHYQLMTNLGDLADHLHLAERDRLYGTRIWQAALTIRQINRIDTRKTGGQKMHHCLCVFVTKDSHDSNSTPIRQISL